MKNASYSTFKSTVQVLKVFDLLVSSGQIENGMSLSFFSFESLAYFTDVYVL